MVTANLFDFADGGKRRRNPKCLLPLWEFAPTDMIYDNGSVKIKPREWIDKKTWREINDILRMQDFKWFGDGKDSCWINMIAS